MKALGSALLISLALSACGVKAPPRPPEVQTKLATDTSTDASAKE